MCMDAGIAVRGFLEDGKNAGDRVLGVPIIGGFDETENAEFISASTLSLELAVVRTNEDIGVSLCAHAAENCEP